jgi:hypothetical protein
LIWYFFFKLIIINCIAIDIILHSHFPFAGLLKFVFVYLANTPFYDKSNNKITELRTILQRESQNS